jgi:transposase
MRIVHHLGIDVDLRELEVLLIEKGGKRRKATFSNDEAGAAALVVWLGKSKKGCRAIVEATSRFHRLVERTLLRAGVLVDVMNPRQARDLARGLGIIDKDDPTDAACLARAAQVLEERKDTKRHSTLAQDLRDESRAITQLTRTVAELKKSLQGLDPGSPAAIRIKQACKALQEQIKQAEAEWTKRLAGEPEIQRRYKLARGVRSVGHKTARVVAVELPADLDACNLRRASAYAGLVPRRHRSGTKELPDQICQGNAHLRTGLFMAATLGVYQHAQYKPFYDSLFKRGKTHMQVMVAVMHKLLRTIVAVIKRGTPWTQIPTQTWISERFLAQTVDMC